MANIMSMKDIRNKPTRSGFDLSTRKNFTSKVGEILPVWHRSVLPGDVFTIDLKTFTRTIPVNTAAQARIREYYDFFFVPYSQLWNKFDAVVTQMNSNLQHASGVLLSDNSLLSGSFPYTSCFQLADYIFSVHSNENKFRLNPFGYERGVLTCKLLQYLGYGDYSSYLTLNFNDSPMLNNLRLSLFPLAAYQKIYSDFFRYTQWEKSNPSTFNFDYVKGTDDLSVFSSLPDHWLGFLDDMNIFDLRYCNYQKDLFHGVLPVAQYGSASVAPVHSGSVSYSANGKILKDSYGVDMYVDDPRVAGNPVPLYMLHNTGFSSDSAGGDTLNSALGTNNAFLKSSASFKGSKDIPVNVNGSLDLSEARFAVSVLALRQAEFLQKWKEVALSAEEDYKSQIQKHWGISVSDYLSGQSRYLGGIATGVDIGEVINNNISGDNDAAIAGKGTSSSNGTIRFESKGEYGIIMCVYHALPIMDYTGSGIHSDCLLTEATQFPIPELDQIGMESVPLALAMNPVKKNFPDLSPSLFFGYAPRYINWKTDIDRSVGAFTKKYNTWILPLGDKELIAADSVLFPDNPNVEKDSIGAGFFKVDPAVVTPIFSIKPDSSVDTDHFQNYCYFDVKVVRNLDTNGLPY